MDGVGRKADVTKEFIAYCRGLSTPEVIEMFHRADQTIQRALPVQPGTYYFGYVFQKGDMPIMLAHFGFGPYQPLELWVTMQVDAATAIQQAKIVDKTAYP